MTNLINKPESKRKVPIEFQPEFSIEKLDLDLKSLSTLLAASLVTALKRLYSRFLEKIDNECPIINSPIMECSS